MKYQEIMTLLSACRVLGIETMGELEKVKALARAKNNYELLCVLDECAMGGRE